MTEQEQPKNDFMHKLALQIVERRNLVFLIVILGTIFTIFSRSWVKVESDLTTYLPKTSETRMGLDIMEKEFTTYGSADVMVANITPDEADQLNDELAGLRGIQMIEYDDTTAHYNNVSALYSITFDYPEDDDQCLETLESVKEYLKDYDIYVSTSLGNTQEETIEREVNVIMVYVAIIIVVVLIFTSQTYAEVPVLLLTFVVGMILNMGTNFLLGTISFVSNSVTNILQLALSLDYAIIFCNHFKEEHETLPLKEAVIESLAKSIPEISSSSLTTIGGLVAMLFMQFKIGPDMGICLIKAIAFALLGEDESKTAAATLNQMVIENGYHLNTGFLSTPFLCDVLAKYGYTDTAYKLLLQPDAPGWLYEVGKGATTVWETWTGIDENGKPHESLNHYSYGAICGWLFGGVCGIHYAGGTLTIAPTPDKSLGWAKAAYDSPAGRIVSGWHYDADTVAYEFEIPANLTADVTLPDGRKLTLTPGKHTV